MSEGENITPLQEMRLTPSNRKSLEREILRTYRQQPNNTVDVSDGRLQQTTTGIIDTMLHLQEIAISRPHPKIKEDTDIVWEIVGPGSLTQDFGDKQDRYRDKSWSRKMDRARWRVSTAIVREVTAQRVGKPTQDVTDEDILQYGPDLIYTGTPDESRYLREFYRLHGKDYNLPPKKKVFTYDQVKNPDGTTHDSYNTADGILCLEFPENRVPRRIIAISHAQHLTRILYILQKYKEKIPNSTILQVYPIAAPKNGEFDYAIMEGRGTLTYAYDFGTAATTPHKYEV